MMSKFAKIHIWFPDVFQYKGGIQVYNSFLIKAMEDVLNQDTNINIFLKNDAKRTDELQFDKRIKFHFAGSWKHPFLRTLVFTLQIFWASLWQRPDLIICGHINFSPLALRIFQFLKIPYWVIVHGVDAWAEELLTPDKIRGLKAASKIISVSGYTRDRIVFEQKIPIEKISLLPNTFDSSKLSIQPKPKYLLDRYHFQPNQPIILTVARLDRINRYKGYDQIISALPEIRRQIPNIHYLLVGKGPDRDRIESMIDAANVKDCVTFAGFVADNELSDHYNLCDVFAMPAKAEGFGIVYLEALACGKPTIGGNQDGAIDALCHGELGVLINPDDINQISETIIDILQKKHPLPILYQPETLREKVIDVYGFASFKHKLSRLLSDLG